MMPAWSAGVVALMIGCAGGDHGRDNSRDSAVGPAAARPAPAPWYSRARTLELTGDGQPDSVHLQAIGERPDSLRITLSLIVAGEEKHREQWGSSYELALADSAIRIGSRVDVFLRAQLDTVLSSVAVERIGAPGVRLMKEDSAVFAGLSSRPTHRISFSYGYETTVRLVWDAARARFVRLWSCC
jgi:hypothetical protein